MSDGQLSFASTGFERRSRTTKRAALLSAYRFTRDGAEVSWTGIVDATLLEQQRYLKRVRPLGSKKVEAAEAAALEQAAMTIAKLTMATWRVLAESLDLGHIS